MIKNFLDDSIQNNIYLIKTLVKYNEYKLEKLDFYIELRDALKSLIFYS